MVHTLLYIVLAPKNKAITAPSPAPVCVYDASCPPADPILASGAAYRWCTYVAPRQIGFALLRGQTDYPISPDAVSVAASKRAVARDFAKATYVLAIPGFADNVSGD